MSQLVEYRKFKKQVLQNANFECEICGTSDGLTVHHMLKQSTFPQFRLDPVNGVCLCGACHSKIEQMWRDKEDFYGLLSNRLDKAHKWFGVTWKVLGVDREEDCEHS
jgi:hypothetical protein